MKKTISINIGSIIFHVEEDGYERLKSYLDSVNKYFSSFEDYQEIISDIENRIAEIFLLKLAGGKQTVTLQDVEELIATMGTTRDFEATLETEPEEDIPHEKGAGERKPPKDPDQPARATRRLYRDTKRRLLGGVAAGIAHFFHIDPLWIRGLIILLIINIFNEGFSGLTILAYIILWIVLPENDHLEEDTKVKKLFRNPDDRVLGGIASGIAAYFAVDPSIIRLVFVLSIFLGGAGIIVYVILWIITPEAKSITEKMQMEGQPVTLSNIEEKVKRSLQGDEGEENALVKILLFPFRLIALIIRALGQFLGPFFKFLVEAVRVLFGALLVLSGLAVFVGLTAAMLTLLGFNAWAGFMHFSHIPIDLLQESLDTWAVLSLYGVLVIPALAICLVGLVVIIQRRVSNPYVGWALFTLWIISIVAASFTIPQYLAEFGSQGEVRDQRVFELTSETPTLYLEKGGHPFLEEVELRLAGHDDSTYQLLIEIESWGRTQDRAQENARSVQYNVRKEGEAFYFDSNITFPEGAKFRFQEVQLTFYIPYGKKFMIDRSLGEILDGTLRRNGYRTSDLEGNEWTFEHDGIKCLTCLNEKGDSNLKKKYGNDQVTYPFEDFQELEITSFFDVEVVQGEEYGVLVQGKRLDDVHLKQVGKKLEIQYGDDSWKWWKNDNREKILVKITMPRLKKINVTGNCSGTVSGFSRGKMQVEMVGATNLKMSISPDELEASLTGASELQLTGESEKMEVELVGASKLEAMNFRASRVWIDALGASSAEVYAEEELDIEAAGASHVRYRGTDHVRIESAGISTVKKD